LKNGALTSGASERTGFCQYFSPNVKQSRACASVLNVSHSDIAIKAGSYYEMLSDPKILGFFCTYIFQATKLDIFINNVLIKLGECVQRQVHHICSRVQLRIDAFEVF
jgi:hypothetical protein